MSSPMKSEGNGRVISGMIKLMLGGGVAKLIGILSIPLLTRLYGPEEFGLYSVSVAAILIIAPFLSAGYSAAIPLSRSVNSASNIFFACIFIISIQGTLILGALYFSEGLIRDFLPKIGFLEYWPIIIFSAMMIEMNESANMLLAKGRAYSSMSKGFLSQSIFSDSSKIAFGFVDLRGNGLLLGFLIGSFASLIYLIYESARLKILSVGSIKLRRVNLLLAINSTFPKYRLPSQILVLISLHIPVFMTSFMYGDDYAGYLGLALMAITLPVNLIGENMAKAYYSEASRLAKKRRELHFLTREIVFKLFSFSIIPALAIYLLSPYLFPLAFGDKWQMAGEMASILSIYLVFQFIQKPIPYLMLVQGGQIKLFLINLQRVIVSSVSFFISHYLSLDVLNAVLLYALSISAHHGLIIFLLIFKTKNENEA